MSINENNLIINRKVLLVKHGESNASLARKCGCTAQAMSQAILGITHSLRIHRAVCTILGVELAEFWPEFYGPIEKSVSHDAKINEVHEAVN